MGHRGKAEVKRLWQAESWWQREGRGLWIDTEWEVPTVQPMSGSSRPTRCRVPLPSSPAHPLICPGLCQQSRVRRRGDADERAEQRCHPQQHEVLDDQMLLREPPYSPNWHEFQCKILLFIKSWRQIPSLLRSYNSNDFTPLLQREFPDNHTSRVSLSFLSSATIAKARAVLN